MDHLAWLPRAIRKDRRNRTFGIVNGFVLDVSASRSWIDMTWPGSAFNGCFRLRWWGVVGIIGRRSVWEKLIGGWEVRRRGVTGVMSDQNWKYNTRAAKLNYEPQQSLRVQGGISRDARGTCTTQTVWWPENLLWFWCTASTAQAIKV